MPKLRWTFLSLLALLFVAAFLIVVVLHFVGRTRHDEGHAYCASRLHQIGLAIMLYQNDNNQSYPRTDFDNAADPVPTWGTPYRRLTALGPLSPDPSPFAGPAKVDPNDVTASMYLLLREEKLTASVFACPSSTAEAWDYGGDPHTALSWTNWSPNGLAKCMSYSFFNGFPSASAVKSGFKITDLPASFAVASDINPGGLAVTQVDPKSNWPVMRSANSPNHDGTGQNVLYGDGHSEWKSTPFCGTNGDNIFTAAGPEIIEPGRGKAKIIAAPVSVTDSVLLPTAADLVARPQTQPDTRP